MNSFTQDAKNSAIEDAIKYWLKTAPTKLKKVNKITEVI
jgi:hypothetical protein